MSGSSPALHRSEKTTVCLGSGSHGMACPSRAGGRRSVRLSSWASTSALTRDLRSAGTGSYTMRTGSDSERHKGLGSFFRQNSRLWNPEWFSYARYFVVDLECRSALGGRGRGCTFQEGTGSGAASDAREAMAVVEVGATGAIVSWNGGLAQSSSRSPAISACSLCSARCPP